MKLSEIGCVMIGVGLILIGTVVIIASITHRFLNIIPFFASMGIIIPAWIVLLQRRKRKQLKGK